MSRTSILLLVSLLGCKKDCDDTAESPGGEEEDTGGSEDTAGEDTAGLDDTGEGNDTGEGSDTGEAGHDFTALNDAVQKQFDSSEMPGFAAALVAEGEVAWVGAYGMANIEDAHPATPDTAWLMASVSKLMVGTAVMQMVEQKKLSLDTPINDVLSFEYDNPKTDDEEVRVRHLVSHTAGIYDAWVWGSPGQEGALYVEGDSEVELGTFLEGYFVDGGQWFSPTANFLNAAPGTRYAYSNIGSSLAGYLIEMVTDEGLDDYSVDAIFEPLGMTNTAWRLAQLNPDEVAMPYRRVGEEYTPYGHFGYPDYPDGLLRSSAADMGRFLAAVSNGGGLDGVRILQEDTLLEMFEPVVPEVEPTQGIFWYWTTLDGRDLLGHSGSDYGVSTDLLYDPSTGIGVVVMTNVEWGENVTRPVVEIERLLFAAGEAL